MAIFLFFHATKLNHNNRSHKHPLDHCFFFFFYFFFCRASFFFLSPSLHCVPRSTRKWAKLLSVLKSASKINHCELIYSWQFICFALCLLFVGQLFVQKFLSFSLHSRMQVREVVVLSPSPSLVQSASCVFLLCSARMLRTNPTHTIHHQPSILIHE